MHPLRVVAECTLVDEVSFCVAGLGLCTRTGVQLTSNVQLSHQLLGELIDEQRFKAGDKIRGPRQVGGWLHNSRQLAIWGVPNTSERGTKSASAHKWAWWLRNPYPSRGRQRFRAEDKTSSGPKVGRSATCMYFCF